MNKFKLLARRVGHLLDRFVIRVKCKTGRHQWETPLDDMCGEKYYQYGKRVCGGCGRAETLHIDRKGGANWSCHEEKLKNLKKMLDV